MKTHRLAKLAGVTSLVFASIGAWSDPASAAAYVFQTLDNPNDPTFNQLLGINNGGTIVGYFGSGAAGFANQGYTLVPPNAYVNENFPGSVQTQVTGINDAGITVGFWAPTNLGPGLDSNFGFVDQGGTFTTVNNPSTGTTPPTLNQLLGVNNNNIAVGFYTDAAGVTHGYTYDVATGTFSGNIDDPLAVGNTTTAAINNAGTLAGFYTDAGGQTHGFLDAGGVFSTVDFPGSTATSLLGLNNLGQAVGTETDGTGAMHGLVFDSAGNTFTLLDDPNGIGTTTLNGINDKGSLVGFYVDANGNTHGLLATTISRVPEPGSLPLLLGALVAFLGVSRRRILGFR